MKWLSVYVAAPLCFELLVRAGQNSANTGRVSGHVYLADAGTAAPNVAASLISLTSGAIKTERTSEDGSLIIGGTLVPAGVYV